jgi:hypothetical protein
MKSFVLFPSNAGPFRVEAERYQRREGEIEFWVDGKVVKSVEASSLLTIVEDKEPETMEEQKCH